MAKAKSWNKKHSQEVAHKFDLFESSGGADGWDPELVDKNYIINCFWRADTPNMLKSFLSKNEQGGHSSN